MQQQALFQHFSRRSPAALAEFHYVSYPINMSPKDHSASSRRPAIFGLLWAGTLAAAYHFGFSQGGKSGPNEGTAMKTAGGLLASQSGPFSSNTGRRQGVVVGSATNEEDGQLVMEGETLADLKPEEELDALLTQASSPARNRSLVRLFAKWAELDGATAMAKVATLSEPLLRYEAREAALRHWGMANPAAAWDFAVADNGLNLPENRFDTILRGLGRSDPAKAVEFFSNPKFSNLLNSEGNATAVVDSLYARGHHDQLKSWAEGMPPGAAKESVINRVIDQWARHNPKEAKAWMEAQIQASPKNAVAARTELAESWARVNPSEALQWVQSLPTKEQDPTYVDRVFRRWLDYDRDNAAAQLANMPPSPALDRSIERYSQEIMGRDPAATIPWAESITDEKRRFRAIERVAQIWARKDPNALRNYVNQSGFSEDQQKALLRNLKNG